MPNAESSTCVASSLSSGESRDAPTSGTHRAYGVLAGQMALDAALPITSGILLAIAFMPAPLGILGWVALVPFAAAIARPKATADLYLGTYLGGLLFSLHAQTWIQSRLNGSGLFGSTTLDWLFNGTVWALMWPLALYCGRCMRTWIHAPMFVVLPVAWIAAEFLRQEFGWVVLWSPFPWLQLALTQAPYFHAIQIADLGGAWAICAVVAAVNGGLFDSIVTRRLWPLCVVSLLVGAVWLYGELRLQQTFTRPGPSVALAPVGEVANAGRTSGADMLLWSETAYSANVGEADPHTTKALEEAARGSEATLVVGCSRTANSRTFNSAAVIDPRRGYIGSYDKCFLVPWSEFRPWTWDNGNVHGGYLTHGTSQPVFGIGKLSFGATICYDTCFAGLHRAYSPKPDFFVACSRETSDPTDFIARMLLNMTRLRAVENRRSFVRNVEGGFSGIVTSTGEYIAAPEQPWKAPVSVGRVPIDDRWTLSRVAGDWLAWLCCAIVAVAIVRPRRRT